MVGLRNFLAPSTIVCRQRSGKQAGGMREGKEGGLAFIRRGCLRPLRPSLPATPRAHRRNRSFGLHSPPPPPRPSSSSSRSVSFPSPSSRQRPRGLRRPSASVSRSVRRPSAAFSQAASTSVGPPLEVLSRSLPLSRDSSLKLRTTPPSSAFFALLRPT